ncbi:hypothetical protein [Natrinema thermotolerans]|uniref:hypothetical protein n=1 Tax=Natrinema thermotolerans TaxID=121872 RepID=UPI0006798D40|nr:hypothetical protein [Natrinema thermotolerans]QCC57210.1 hypothetical protein DVR14_00625 [Natrinema thermotolerans]
MTKDVLIYAAREDVRHKFADAVPDHHDYAYWTVSGTPRQTGPGANVYFTDGDRVYARGTVRECVDGELRFDPLERCDEALPAEPVTRGFKYVEVSES